MKKIIALITSVCMAAMLVSGVIGVSALAEGTPNPTENPTSAPQSTVAPASSASASSSAAASTAIASPVVPASKYAFIEGMGQPYIKGSGTDLRFVANGKQEDFVEYLVDGQVPVIPTEAPVATAATSSQAPSATSATTKAVKVKIALDLPTATPVITAGPTAFTTPRPTDNPNNTTIYVPSRYLETLSDGEHELTAKYKDGETATTTFNVTSESSDDDYDDDEEDDEDNGSSAGSNGGAKTNDANGNQATLWFILLGLSLCGITAAVLMNGKKSIKDIFKIFTK